MTTTNAAVGISPSPLAIGLGGSSSEKFLDHSFHSSSSASSSFGAQEICTFEQWTQLPNQPGAFRIFTMISLLAMLVIVVVGGNALVIAAVLMRRRLRTATGLLILSLAVADMLVGLVVLPFSIANEVLKQFWIFGDIWCTAWLTMDIWMCTSSVYNLVAISIDRYIAIIKPLNYHMLITKFRARVIVAFVWISSFIVCSPSFLLASSERKSYIEEQMAKNGTKSAHEFVLYNPGACRCTPSNSGMYYILFSASSSFYIPMIIVIFVYARIYLAAMAATKSQYAGMVQVAENANKKQHAEKHANNCNKSESKTQANGGATSTLKLPKLFGPKVAHLRNKHHFEMHRLSMEPPRSVPISLNSSSMPTVYAQVNGSCGNLQFARNNSNADFDRRRSEEKLLPMERCDERMSPVRRSIPSEVIYEVQGRPPLCPNARTEMESSEESNESSAADETKSMLPVAVPPCSTEAAEAEANGALEGRDSTATAVPNEQPDSQAHTTLLQTQNNSTAVSSPQSSNKSGKSRGRNFATSLLMRILGKAKRKRAAGTYEKRLSLEIKAAKTVAIVTGCFICCWLGFSIYYGLTAFDVHVNEVVWSIFFWLGYLNSAFNPVIYTVFNREFRTCFKQLLTCNNMIFASSRAANQVPMCNSFNSQLRLGNDPMIRSKPGEQSEA